MPSLALTPRGHLLFTSTDDDLLPSNARLRRLESAFGRGSGYGLFELAAGEVGTTLPADLSYWRDFGARLVTAICTQPDLDVRHAPIAAPPLTDLEALAVAAPRAAAGEVEPKRSTSGSRDTVSRDAGVIRPAKPKKAASKRREAKRRLTPATRRAISERMRNP
jgi:hypothetical protein